MGGEHSRSLQLWKPVWCSQPSWHWRPHGSRGRGHRWAGPCAGTSDWACSLFYVRVPDNLRAGLYNSFVFFFSEFYFLLCSVLLWRNYLINISLFVLGVWFYRAENIAFWKCKSPSQNIRNPGSFCLLLILTDSVEGYRVQEVRIQGAQLH